MRGDYLEIKNRRAFRRWHVRLGLLISANVRQPDPRDQELRDRGACLEWRQRVALNLINKRKRAARLAKEKAWRNPTM